MIIIFGFLISPIYAVSDIQISPSNPKVGDTVVLTGTANPNEAINCQAWFEVNPIISPPYYGYLMNSVEIPSSPNNFKVVAENVNKVYVSVKMGIWITKSATANSDGVAIVSQSNVPVGTYDIKIGGTIKDPSKPVKLKIIASTTIKADENGNFKYSYKANNIPEGTVVHLNIGGVSKDVLIEGDIPTPPAEENTPIIEDKNTMTNQTVNLDKEPPKITILSPSKRDYNISKVYFDVIVEDESGYMVKFYLNGNNLDYNESNNHYTGVLNLKEGKNTFEIIAKDEYNNKNRKILYLNYYKPKNQKNENTVDDKSADIASSQNNTSEKIVNNKKIIHIQNNNNSKQENIVYGTIIKHVGNATLIISDGTKISVVGDIQIKEVVLPNITLTYYITPENAEFKPPLTLKVKIKPSQNKEIKVLYYDNKLKSWKALSYTVDEKSNIIIKINKSGYYAIKENEINVNENKKELLHIQIIGFIKAIVSVVINLIKP
ncbi:hypothetical protein [Methanotorris formicicus]